MQQQDLVALARSIPTMVKPDVHEFLQTTASNVPKGSCIVEVGAWLGGTTAHMALGAREAIETPELIVFDRFKATQAEVEKAARAGISLTRGQDTRPQVQEILRKFSVPIDLKKTGILEIEWTHRPIGLYVDDAAKTPELFGHVVRQFGPSWIPGETIVALLDYKYWKRFGDLEKARTLKVQKEFIESFPECFELVMDSRESSASVFRYTKAIDFNAFRFPEIASAVKGKSARKSPLKVLLSRVLPR